MFLNALGKGVTNTGFKKSGAGDQCVWQLGVTGDSGVYGSGAFTGS